MPTDVIMPQMGESIFEGTITKWLKKPGDKVQRDEPLFEISTDKVDAEIPAPASGVLQEIKVAEGNTVQVNTDRRHHRRRRRVRRARPRPLPPLPPLPRPRKRRKPRPATQPPPAATPAAAHEAHDEDVRSSPLVRKIAREHNVDLSQVTGTGLGGRITKQDIMAFIEKGPSRGSAAPRPRRQPTRPQPPAPPSRPPRSRPRPAAIPATWFP